MNEDYIELTGMSGVQYSYYIISSLEGIASAPGNYVFGRRQPDGALLVMNFGETDNMKSELSNHGPLVDPSSSRANIVLVRYVTAGKDARNVEKQDLIRKYRPGLV